MPTARRTLRLTAVQAAPVFLDRDGSIEKACRLIREAGNQGADVIGFPEGFIPCHPLWYHFHAASSPQAFQFAERLHENAVEIPSPATRELCQAAREAGVFVVMGLCERERGRVGTLYNTLLFINADGTLLGRHRKLVPTLGERLVHAPGDASGLRAYPAPFGKISGLMCGENSNSLANFVLDAYGADIHVAAWPSHFNVGNVMTETILLTTRELAYRMKVFLINAVGEISEQMKKELPATEEHRAFLEQQQGGASIIGPWGEVIAGPMGPGEGLLYADVDLGKRVVPKLIQDFGGHYNRFDIFALHVQAGTRPSLHTTASANVSRHPLRIDAPKAPSSESPHPVGDGHDRDRDDREFPEERLGIDLDR